MASSMVLLFFGAAVYYSASATPPPGPKWTVTGSMGTHHMLVANVTAQPGVNLRDIGESVVSPIIGQYDEVLIYVRSGQSTLRRIQWTPEHGYSELLISP